MSTTNFSIKHSWRDSQFFVFLRNYWEQTRKNKIQIDRAANIPHQFYFLTVIKWYRTCWIHGGLWRRPSCWMYSWVHCGNSGWLERWDTWKRSQKYIMKQLFGGFCNETLKAFLNDTRYHTLTCSIKPHFLRGLHSYPYMWGLYTLLLVHMTACHTLSVGGNGFKRLKATHIAQQT